MCNPFFFDPVASQGARRALREGVLVEALNIKAALFFLGFPPQFDFGKNSASRTWDARPKRSIIRHCGTSMRW